MGEERTPCEACGDTRLAFDERYQPRCFTCGASRRQPPSLPLPLVDPAASTGFPSAPPEAVPGSTSPVAPTLADLRAAELVRSHRSPEDRRRNLIIVVSIVLVIVGFILAIILVTMAPDPPPRLR